MKTATAITFLVKDLVIFRFQKCLCQGLLLEGRVDDSKPVEDILRRCLESPRII